ncbi:hypothetical protein KIPB_010571 [Kipferlia bialata]|uniref:Uncharacterized protein n=1 Tax=Kipferlia bialata TaxID=797122 RepID=A0A9K3D3F1_9EUKA|nr:hypothetical protein KIPB_010571 [Kipferlia bialata]|eukprot:g10571.t1
MPSLVCKRLREQIQDAKREGVTKTLTKFLDIADELNQTVGLIPDTLKSTKLPRKVHSKTVAPCTDALSACNDHLLGVMMEAQRGYTINDSVLRAAKVIVAQ